MCDSQKPLQLCLRGFLNSYIKVLKLTISLLPATMSTVLDRKSLSESHNIFTTSRNFYLESACK